MGFYLLTLGCQIEQGLNTKDNERGAFDSGEPVTPPIPEDSEEDSPIDTEPVEPPQCGDHFWPSKAVQQEDECFSDPSVGTWSPTVEWTRQTFADYSSSVSCMMQPIVCSLTDDNGDGRGDDEDTPDVLIITYSPGVLRAMSGDTGAELWAYQGNGDIQYTGGAACADLDNDGWQEVIVALPNGAEVVDHNGTRVWRDTSASGHMDGTSDSPGVADMDGDGSPEVIVGNAIWDANGNLQGAGRYGTGSSTNVGSGAFAVDIDQDGQLEVVTGNALYDINGNELWYNGEADGYPAAADFDGDIYGEIVVTGDAKIRVQDDDGTVLCRANIPGASSSYGGPPTVADFDGDGLAEIGVAANSTYTVFESDCTVLWQYTGTTDPSSGNTGSSVFDFEGDGVADVVYADEHWLWVFDGATGAVKMQDANHTNNTWLEYPSIADIDADGSAEIAVCNTPGSWGNMNGVTVFGDANSTWKAGRRIWNQHGYNITNINEDGTVPANPDTNWFSYNNFRSGDLSAGIGYSGPDLYVKIKDVCVDECQQGNINVWITLGNKGFNDVEDDVLVEFYGVTLNGDILLGTYTYTPTLVAGEETQSQPIELTGVTGPIYDLVVKIDGGDDATNDAVSECYENNNEERWGVQVCW